MKPRPSGTQLHLDLLTSTPSKTSPKPATRLAPSIRAKANAPITIIARPCSFATAADTSTTTASNGPTEKPCCRCSLQRQLLCAPSTLTSPPVIRLRPGSGNGIVEGELETACPHPSTWGERAAHYCSWSNTTRVSSPAMKLADFDSLVGPSIRMTRPSPGGTTTAPESVAKVPTTMLSTSTRY